MKVLVFILSCAAVSSAALLPGYVNYNDGKYYPDNTGQYVSGPVSTGRYYPVNYVQDYGFGRYSHDESGKYVPDDSGKYIHDDNPYIHQDNPYIHDNVPAVPYAHKDNPYVASPNTQSQIRVPINTYLPAAQPTSYKPKVVPRPVIVTPKPTYTGGGNYKWNLDLAGNHGVEHPHYGLQVQLHNAP